MSAIKRLLEQSVRSAGPTPVAEATGQREATHARQTVCTICGRRQSTAIEPGNEDRCLACYGKFVVDRPRYPGQRRRIRPPKQKPWTGQRNSARGERVRDRYRTAVEERRRKNVDGIKDWR